MKIKFDFIWVPNSLGGHNSEPFKGMRTAIRWQKYLNDFLKCARDVQWESIDFNKETKQGSAICTVASDDPLPDEWFKEGELIELLSGYRVLAIGCLVSAEY